MPCSRISPMMRQISRRDQRRQAFGRLVEDQQIGVGHQRAADGQHLLLAAGQLGAAVAAAARRGAETSAARARRSSRAGRRVRAPPSPGSRAPSGWEKCRGLPARRRCPGARCDAAPRRSSPAPSPCTSPWRGGTRPSMRAQQRGLAHAVAAHQPDRLAAPDRCEIDAVQDVARAVKRVQAARLEQRRHLGMAVLPAARPR